MFNLTKVNIRFVNLFSEQRVNSAELLHAQHSRQFKTF